MNNIRVDQPSVSIIIPMYKCERFLDDTLKMVRGQTLKEIEIICVLDGPDESLKTIIDSHSEEDERIICLEQEHRGAGPARNAGLNIAKGEYLLFLDADDLFRPNLAERLYKEAAKYDADIAICSYAHNDMRTKINSTGIGYDYSRFPENTVIDCTKVEKLYSAFIGAAWNKLFRRAFIENLGLTFMDTRISNDEFFVTAAMTAARRLVSVKENLLTIRRFVNADSITASRAKYSEDIVIVMNQLYLWLRERGYWETREEDYYSKVAKYLEYNSSFDYNERYVEEMARVLSTEKPWKNLSNVKLIQVLNMRLSQLETIRDNVSDEVSALKDTVDVSGREYVLKMCENRVYNTRKIRSAMKQRYGRDLSKKDPLIKRLLWSLENRGLKGTMRKAKEKRQGEIVLIPTNVICTGHITTAGHYLVFFMPVETYREKVSVEDLSVVVRCNGYYPFAVSGEGGTVFTPLGPRRTPIINGAVPTRHEELMRVHAEVSPGFGVFIQVRFKESLLKTRKGDRVDNNCSVSVHLSSGKIILK